MTSTEPVAENGEPRRPSVGMSALADLLWSVRGHDSIDVISERATAAGHPISRGAVAKYLQGQGAKKPPESTLEALAAGFKLRVTDVRRAAGLPAGELGPYEPTSEAGQLSREQRDALDQLIRAIVRGGGRGAGPAPKKRAGGSPAQPEIRLGP